MMVILFVIAMLLLRVCVAAVVHMRQQHESGVVGRVGKVRDPAGRPAFTRLRPVVDRMTKVNRQVMTLSVPSQDYVTKDNVAVRVDAVVYFRVVGAVNAPGDVRDDRSATSPPAQAFLRSVIGSAELVDLLPDRERLGAEPTTPKRPVGPQDAPPLGPRDAAGRPQDATQVDLASTIAVATTRSATTALRELAASGRMPVVRLDRDDITDVPDGALARERTVLDSLPRPLAGPAYLGGRDDAAYLRGWDDAVDWIRQGNEELAPSWGIAAYMTGWNDAVRAIARTRMAGAA